MLESDEGQHEASHAIVARPIIGSLVREFVPQAPQEPERAQRSWRCGSLARCAGLWASGCGRMERGPRGWWEKRESGLLCVATMARQMDLGGAQNTVGRVGGGCACSRRCRDLGFRIAADRPGMQVAVSHQCGPLLQPTTACWITLDTYFKDHPRLECEFRGMCAWISCGRIEEPPCAAAAMSASSCEAGRDAVVKASVKALDAPLFGGGPRTEGGRRVVCGQLRPGCRRLWRNR